ncbi:Sec-independent protein translocase protein TatB [Tabrizicola sp.]|uniref:Sec-independent protein translocase protein TatB n=1 Tax=Tabrizicola sp. TaxID=2005166 RepID=UPI0035AF1616
MDFSWSEMLLVGIVALIVIGPKDLPGMFRELGRFTAKIRSMGREFSRAMEQAAKESGVKDAADGLRAVSNPVGTGLKTAADKFEKWDPLKNAAVPTKPLTPPPMPAAMAPAAAPAAPAAAAAPAAPAAPVGPATAALYEQKAARQAVVDEAASKLRALSQPGQPGTTPAAPPASAVRRSPGRRRVRPETSSAEDEE